MPIKTWTTEADFTTWTLTDLEATVDGKLALVDGASEGSGVSPAYEALDWVRWGRLRLEVEQPTGTNVYLRWRSGATEAECLSATWSPYVDAADDNGVIIQNLRTYYLNNPAETVGAWLQVEVILEAE